MKKFKDHVMETLRSHYLFAGLSDAEYARLQPSLRISELSAAQTLFRQHDDAAFFYLLYSGTVKLYRLSDEGQEKIMRLIQPGQSFAESVMFMDRPRYPVHAEGVRPSVVVAIESTAYLDLMQSSFALCRAVLARMTERIQAHWDEIEALTLQNSRYRVIAYLISLVPPGSVAEVSVTLPVSKSLIASQLAITPETLSRILRQLAEGGLIRVQGARVEIPNVEELQTRLMR